MLIVLIKDSVATLSRSPFKALEIHTRRDEHTEFPSIRIISRVYPSCSLKDKDKNLNVESLRMLIDASLYHEPIPIDPASTSMHGNQSTVVGRISIEIIHRREYGQFHAPRWR